MLKVTLWWPGDKTLQAEGMASVKDWEERPVKDDSEDFGLSQRKDVVAIYWDRKGLEGAVFFNFWWVRGARVYLHLK